MKPATKMTLPAELLRAVSQQRGQVVLVVGAGCSVEGPTEVPLTDVIATEAHRLLRADNVLSADCRDPTDLSVVADAVVAATGSQSALVLRLPKNKFLMARPNTGHLLAAALLREQSISCLLTLNFDLAMNAALSMVGGESDVSVIAGPKDHSDLGQTNLVYLHGNASSQPEDWVLTTDALGHQEYLDWRGVIVGKVLGGPVTVFAGLGARSAVLIETTRAISDAVKDAQVFQVDKAPHGTTAFSEELNLPAADHILNRPGFHGDPVG